jgi:TPR repeat protein
MGGRKVKFAIFLVIFIVPTAALWGVTTLSHDGADVGTVQKEVSKVTPAMLSELQRAAENGDAIAQNHLANLYTYGQDIPQDYEMASKWYTASAAQGLAAAQYNLGALYEHGEGVPKDYGKAVTYYRAAAQEGHVLAQARMGLMYERGLGVPKNSAEAVRWYRAAAEHGDASAQSKLGYAYFDGEAIRRDYREATKWFRKAAEDHHLASLLFSAHKYSAIFQSGLDS